MPATNMPGAKVTSPQARKGHGWERDLAAWFNGNGFPGVERAYGAGRPADVGDLDGLPGFCIEAKNQKRFDLAGWVDEAVEEAVNCTGRRSIADDVIDLPVVIAKRPRRPPGDAYVVMPLWAWAALLDRP